MKRISSVIFFLLFTIVAFSADINKEFNKMIAKYDVSDSAKVVPQNNPKRFWEAMLYHNEACIKFLRDIKKIEVRREKLCKNYRRCLVSILSMMNQLLKDCKDFAIRCSLIWESQNCRYHVHYILCTQMKLMLLWLLPKMMLLQFV